MPEQQDATRNRKTPGAGGTSTPISGSESGTGEKDPVVSEEAGQQQSSPASNVLTKEDEQAKDQDTSGNPDAPEHGGYGRPV